MFGNAKPSSNFSIDALMSINRPPQNNSFTNKDMSRIHHPTPRSHFACVAASMSTPSQLFNVFHPNGLATTTNNSAQAASSPPPPPPRAIRSKKSAAGKAARRRNSSSSSASSSLSVGGDQQQTSGPTLSSSKVTKTLPPPQRNSETPDTTTSDSGGANPTATTYTNSGDGNGDNDGDPPAGGGKSSAPTTSRGGGKILRGSGSGGGSGISPAQLNIGTSSCYELVNVQCHLEMRELWQKFNELGTEMIITRSGRRMFPTIRVAFTGLDPKATYAIFMDIVPVDQKRYRYAYHKSSWLVAGKAEATPASRLYAHPDGPMCGEQLRKQVISFEKIKLTNFTCDKNGHVVLHSMHRYQPRIHLVVVDRGSSGGFVGGGHVLGGSSNAGGGGGHGGCATSAVTECLKTIGSIQQLEHFDYKTFMFKETTFYSVTAYQNQLITKLKIDSNPFAKGFRDSTRIITDLDRDPHSMMMSTMMMLSAGGDPFRMAAQFGGGGMPPPPPFMLPGMLMHGGMLPSPPGYPMLFPLASPHQFTNSGTVLTSTAPTSLMLSHQQPMFCGQQPSLPPPPPQMEPSSPSTGFNLLAHTPFGQQQQLPPPPPPHSSAHQCANLSRLPPLDCNNNNNKQLHPFCTATESGAETLNSLQQQLQTAMPFGSGVPPEPLMASLLRRWLLLNGPHQLNGGVGPSQLDSAETQQCAGLIPPAASSPSNCNNQAVYQQNQAFAAALMASQGNPPANFSSLQNNNVCDFSSPFHLVLRLQAAATAAAAAAAAASTARDHRVHSPQADGDDKNNNTASSPTACSPATASASPNHSSSFHPYDGSLKRVSTGKQHNVSVRPVDIPVVESGRTNRIIRKTTTPPTSPVLPPTASAAKKQRRRTSTDDTTPLTIPNGPQLSATTPHVATPVPIHADVFNNNIFHSC